MKQAGKTICLNFLLVVIADERKSFRRRVMWRKLVASDTVDRGEAESPDNR